LNVAMKMRCAMLPERRGMLTLTVWIVEGFRRVVGIKALGYAAYTQADPHNYSQEPSAKNASEEV